jgi:hypothetical protein
MYVCVMCINVASFKMQYIVPNQEIERSRMCVLCVSMLSLSTICPIGLWSCFEGVLFFCLLWYILVYLGK